MTLGLALGLLGCLLLACAPVPTDPSPDDDDPPTPPGYADELSAVGRVLGYVYTDGEGRAVVHPRPVTEPGLTPSPAATVLLDTGAYARTNEGGLFVMAHVPEGDRVARVWLGPGTEGPPAVTLTLEVARNRTRCLGSKGGGGEGPGAAVGWVYEVDGGVGVSPCPRSGLRPLSGARVSIGGAEATTSEVGFYLLPAVRAGTHTVSVDGASQGAVTVVSGQAACGTDAALKAWAAAAGHAGLAYDASEPYVSVEPTAQTVLPLPGSLVALDTGQQVLTDERGAYTLYGVEPGLRTLTVAAPGYGGAARVLITLAGVVTRGSQAPAGSIGRIDLAGAKGVGFVEVGEALPLRRVATSPTGMRWDGFATFDWEISDTTRATIDRHGRVRGRAMGEVTVTARAGGAEASLDLLVEPKGFRDAATVMLSLDGSSTLSVGSTRTAVAVVRDGEGRVLTGYPVEFRCGDRTVADVTTKGIVAGLREGPTVLVAEALRTGGLSHTIPLTVVPADDRLRVDPLELRFEGASQATVGIRDITAGAEGIMNWTALVAEPWLTLTPSAGSGDGAMVVAAVPGDLPPGVYTALIDIDAGAHGRRLVFVEMSLQRLNIIIE